MKIKNCIAILSTGLISCMIFSGCYYDKSELLYPQAPCDKTVFNYSTAIVPIINAQCNSCHAGAASSGGGVPLDSYAAVKTYVDNGKLLGDVQQASGFNAMPKGSPKMDDCSINKIQAWINAGAPNN